MHKSGHRVPRLLCKLGLRMLRLLCKSGLKFIEMKYAITEINKNAIYFIYLFYWNKHTNWMSSIKTQMPSFLCESGLEMKYVIAET